MVLDIFLFVLFICVFMTVVLLSWALCLLCGCFNWYCVVLSVGVLIVLLT